MGLRGSAAGYPGLRPGFAAVFTIEVPIPAQASYLFLRAVEQGPNQYAIESADDLRGPWAPAAGAVLILVPATSGLAPGSAEAQQQQLNAAAAAALPLEAENTAGMRFRLIPAGTFAMGAAPGEAGAESDEAPVHTVTINKSLWVGTCEVTQGQWKTVMGSDPSRFAGDSRRPVEQVNWNQCIGFIQKLNQREGGGYRLLTEAEWEYACRAGTGTPFYAGSAPSDLDRAAWYWSTSGHFSHPVGGKTPNAWGLYDTLGNVAEWVEDDYFISYSNAPADGTARMKDPRHWVRVQRGGGWASVPSRTRSAARFGDHRDFSSYVTGLRLARDVTAP